MKKEKEIIGNLLSKVGITLNSNNPWDIQVHNENFYRRVISYGSLGLGESYMDGWWDCKELDQFFFKVLRANLKERIQLNWVTIKTYLISKVFNLQTKKGSKKVIDRHYNLSTKLYTSFLDPYNQYTCGYFKNTLDLNVAQEQKLQLICQKLQLKKEDRVLDIGCGWGGFAKFASEHYGCNVTGITISKEQAAYARQFTKGLPVNIEDVDYRNLDGEYDKILICGMIEHVGQKNYRRILTIVNKILAKDGLFLLHTIGNNISLPGTDPWIEKIYLSAQYVAFVKAANHGRGRAVCLGRFT